jgi:hypothetical protein
MEEKRKRIQGLIDRYMEQYLEMEGREKKKNTGTDR